MGFVKTNDIIPAYAEKLQPQWNIFPFALYVSDCRAFCCIFNWLNFSGNNLSSLASKNNKIQEENIEACKSSFKLMFNLHVAVI